MARLSDIIEEFIKQSMESNSESELEIKRNELANYFSCAPSQINYVLTTRFTTDRGYYIESKRGGGGCIIIRRVTEIKNNSLVQVLNEKIGHSITYNNAVQILNSLYELNFITEREYNILKITINDRTLISAMENKNKVRADILRTVVMTEVL